MERALLTIAIILVVSAALCAGALWGISGRISGFTEGFLVALAGGALLVSALLELINPSFKHSQIGWLLLSILCGALIFTGLDYLVKKRWGAGQGSGLLVAITLDGVPENLALGVSLIGAAPMTVAALACSIFLSNLPEAAGGAREMSESGHSKQKIFLLWSGTALLLAAAALMGHWLLRDASDASLGYIRCFAAGAVVASLAIEVFPKAFRKDNYWSGLATVLGLILALFLHSLSAA